MMGLTRLPWNANQTAELTFGGGFQFGYRAMDAGNTYIFGFGDEVVVTLAAMIAAFVVLVAASHLYRHTQRVHPAEARVVEAFRDEKRPGPAGRVPRGDRKGAQGRRDDNCPFCLDVPTDPVESNCGHVYCTECFEAYWRFGNMARVRCPCCRGEVNLVVPLAGADRPTPGVHQYNRLYSGRPLSLWERLREAPVLLRLAWNFISSPRGAMWLLRGWRLVSLLIGLTYAILPVDLVPETIFGVIGLVDDIIVQLCVALFIAYSFRAMLGQA